MTTVIEHVRHRVVDLVEHEAHPGPLLWTACGRVFLPSPESLHTRHHLPARHRCRECYR